MIVILLNRNLSLRYVWQNLSLPLSVNVECHSGVASSKYGCKNHITDFNSEKNLSNLEEKED